MRRLRARARRSGDSGVTLVEQVVAMSIFAVVVAIFMAALVSMTTGTSRVQNTADASDGLRSAFLRMDRQVRYADAVNLPGRGASTSWYVEFRTSQRTTAPPTLCTQWRVDVAAGTLQVRSWADGSAPGAQWSTIATGLQEPAVAPFVVSAAAGDRPYQRLAVHLTAGRGSGRSAGGAQVDSTFVARNSSTSSPSNLDANGNGVSDTPVCTAATRP